MSTVSISNITLDSAVISWTNLGDGYTYNIKYSNDNGITFIQEDNVSSGLTISSLVTKSTYDVYIQSVFNSVASDWSSPAVSFTTLSPEPPTNLAVQNITLNSVNLTWDDFGSGYLYSVRYSNDGGNSFIKQINVSNGGKISSLETTSTYEIYIQSIYNSVASAWSSIAVEFTTLSPEAPSDLSVGSITLDSAVLSWTSLGEGYLYNIRFTNDNGLTYIEENNVSSGVTISSLETGSSYKAYIQSIYNLVESDWSSTPVNFTTLTLQPPSDLSVGSVTLDSVVLSWTDLGSGYTYNIKYTSDNGLTFTQQNNVSNGVILGSLQTAVSYKVYIQSVYNLVASDWSSISVDFTTLSPEAPSDLSVGSVTLNSAVLSWTSLGDGYTYNIKYTNDGGSSFMEENNVSSGVTISSLETGSTYEVYIQSIYNLVSSSWSSTGVEFTTLSPEAPSDLTVGSITLNSAILSWTSLGFGYTYNIRYTSDNGSTFTQQDNVSPGVSISSLSTNKNYKVYIQSIFNLVSSSWSSTAVEFMTLSPDAPSDLSVGSITLDSAVLSWTSLGFGYTYNVRYTSDNGLTFVQKNNVTDGLTLGSLQTAVSYKVYIQSVYNSVASSWSSTPVIFTTLSPQSPSDLSVGSISLDSAVLSWTSLGSGYTYNIKYTSDNGITFTQQNNVSDGLTLGSLQTAVSYKVYIQSVYNSVASSWSSTAVEFTTLSATIPSDLSVGSITLDSAVLSWTNLGSGYTYNVRYTNDGGLTFIQKNNVSIGVVISSLATNSTYKVYIQSVFNSVASPWSSTAVSFTTLSPQTPSGLSVGSISLDSAVLSWISLGSGYTYNVRYTSDNGITFTQSINLSNGESISSLETGTTYKVYIQSVYNLVASPWSSTAVEFTTLSASIPSDLSVGSITLDSAVLSWTSLGDGYSYNVRYSNDNGSSFTLKNNVSSGVTISSLATGSSYKLYIQSIFNSVASPWSSTAVEFTTLSPNIPSDLSVGGITLDSAVLSWTSLGSGYTYNVRYTSDNGLTYTQENDVSSGFTISSLQTDVSYKVYIQSVYNFVLSSWSSSAVSFSTLSPQPPTDLSVGNITLDSVVLSWTLLGSGYTYNIKYSNDNLNFSQIDDVSSGVKITSLEKVSDYSFYIQSEYGGVLSDWSNNIDFTTIEIPNSLSVSNIQIDSVVLSWTSLGSGYTYNIQYGKNNFNLGTGTVINNVSSGYNLSGLIDNTSYDIYIQSVYETVKSDWSNVVSFTTLVYNRSDTAYCTAKFDMTGKLYNDLKNSDDSTQNLVITNALASIYDINPYGISVSSLQFNSIDVIFEAQGVFPVSNFEINMSDETNIVNAFVSSANDAGLGTYNSSDVSLTGVDSKGIFENSEGTVISFSCFAEGSLVKTDQGEIEIQKIRKNFNTINGLKVKAVTKTIYGEDNLVLIKKDSINISQPSKDLIVSGKHRFFLNNGAVCAKDLVKKYNGIEFIKNDGRVLYNILVEDNIGIIVNNLKAESLNKNNVLAKLYTKYNNIERNKIIIEMNRLIKNGLIKKYNNYCKDL